MTTLVAGTQEGTLINSELDSSMSDLRKRRPRAGFDLTGQRFGRLVAVRNTGVRNPAGGYEWECKCDCGGGRAARVSSLRSGRVRSCGCLFRDVVTAPRPYRRIRPYEPLFNQFRRQAGDRGIEVRLTFEEFLGFTAQLECHYCGAEVTWQPHPGKGDLRRTNLDRKDNSRGYEQGNLVVCCWQCNDGKGARYTYGEWKSMTAALRVYREARDGA